MEIVRNDTLHVLRSLISLPRVQLRMNIMELIENQFEEMKEMGKLENYLEE